MFNNPSLLQQQLVQHVALKFGESLTHDVQQLIERVWGKDAFIDQTIGLNLQNMLALDLNDAAYFVDLALKLSESSPVVPVLLFEKIPTLVFYGITTEVGQFLLATIDYSVRATAYYLGCDQRKIDDLTQILEESNLAFYKILLRTVTDRHAEFGMLCGLIMRHAVSIESLLRSSEIPAYLDTCSALITHFGAPIAEQYIRHTLELAKTLPLREHYKKIAYFFQQSPILAEFFVTYPTLLLAELSKSPFQPKHDQHNLRRLKLELLTTENYCYCLYNPWLFEDREFFSMVMNWPTLHHSIKQNIVFQLQQDNYKHYLINHPEMMASCQLVTQATQGHWLSSWTFCQETISLTYVRQRVSKLLQDKYRFSLEAKTMIKTHAAVFDRTNTDYDAPRVASIVNILLTYCVDEATTKELNAMYAFVLGNREPLKNWLSESALVIQTWERDPWFDYGRADELFSCTSLGDYNAANAPAFLTDLNLSHLDIWSQRQRVGRIHLALTRGTDHTIHLLLDCVDGSERVINSKKKLADILKAVKAYAGWLGLPTIKINYEVDFNTTPKKFIAYVEHSLNHSARIDYLSRLLVGDRLIQRIPYPCQTYLESFNQRDGAFVRGALIHANE